MRKRLINLFFVFYLIFSGIDQLLAEPLPMDKLIQKFDQITDQGFQDWQLPGLAIAVVTADTVVHLKSYGVCKIGSKESINAHTLFRIASLSKGFSAVLALKLGQKGFFQLDDPISHYLPEVMIGDAMLTKQLKIKHLLSHTNGVKEYFMEQLAYTKHHFQEIIDQLPQAQKTGCIGQHFQYQNVLFNLFQPIVERSTGSTFSEVMEREILYPLNMHHTVLTEAAYEQVLNKAQAHQYKAGHYQPLFSPSYYHSILAAGGIASTITDMSQWLQALLGGNSAILSTQQLTHLFTPIVKVPLDSKRFKMISWTRQRLSTAHYGLGWFIYDYMGHQIVYHSGRLSGCGSLIAFSPAKQIGIVILANSDTLFPAALMAIFFDLLFDLPRVDWNKTLLAKQAILNKLQP